MAIAKIAPPLAGIRGTVGGLTYSANKSGPYVKLWAKGSNPRTPKQSQQRANIAQWPQEWRDLTAGERLLWNIFAALPAQDLVNSLGETYSASGFNWFTKCNSRLDRIGRGAITATPTQARPAAPTVDDFRVDCAGTESNIATGGVATSSTEAPTGAPAKAFDDDLSAGDAWNTLPPATTGWIQYVLPAAENIKRYRMYMVTNVGVLNRAPVDWTFQVWTGGAWQTIHTVTGETPVQDTWFDYDIINPYTETTYRWNVTQNNGSGTNLRINELEMYLGDEGRSVIFYPEDEFVDAPDWDLVLHVAQGATEGRQVWYPNYFETLLDTTPDATHEHIQSELEEVFGTIQPARSWFARLYRQTQEGIRSAAGTFATVTQPCP